MKETYKPIMKHLKAPLFMGAGLKILFITLEARYHWGITDVYQGYNNQYLQLGAAISF